MRRIKIDRSGDVVLNPLTDVGVGMFMTIRISRSQFVVNILRHRERGQSQDNTDQPECDS